MLNVGKAGGESLRGGPVVVVVVGGQELLESLFW